MDQHCRGTRLSYKHILLAKLRAELLAVWGTCQAGRRKGLLFSTSVLLRNVAAFLPYKSRFPGAVGLISAAGTRRNE